MRRAVHALGTLLVVAGVLGLLWAVLVWRWQDPVTAFYTHLEQRKLAAGYEDQVAAFQRREPTPAPPTDAEPAPASPSPSFADLRRRVRSDAKRYRQLVDEGDPVGRLIVPRLDLNMMVVDGTDSDTLQKGPGRYRGSYMPGQGELVYVAGHRTTYSAPFSRIDRLRRGDRVTFELPYAAFEYRITRSIIVPATALEVLRSHGRELLALQACHPRFFASHRYIAYAEPVRVVARGPGGRSFPAAALAAG
jgi:sortase A